MRLLLTNAQGEDFETWKFRVTQKARREPQIAQMNADKSTAAENRALIRLTPVSAKSA